MAEAKSVAQRLAVQRSNVWRSMLLFLSIVGPGIITANADNDVGGIATYGLAGAQFGYSLLWLLIPVTIALLVVQEMCARMGAVTGKGLADLIRENFGVRITFWVLVVFVLGDLANTATEFAGVAEVAPIFHISKYLLVPATALFVFTVVVRGNYRIVEKIFFFFCFVYISYAISAFIVAPDWHDVLKQLVLPHFSATKAYVLMAIGVIGTTISPWMQFYIQAAVVEKGVKAQDLKYSRIDVISGAIFTDVIAFFIIVASAATIFVHNQGVSSQNQINISDAGQLAEALAPLASKYASLLFAIGLLNAGIFTATILPLSTAYYICEAFGFPSGIDRRFREAPFFYSFYATMISLGGGAVILPGAPLLAIIFYSQVLNGVLLPVVLVLMLLLINNRSIMGEYTNSPILNLIAWGTVILVGGLTIVSTVQLFLPSG